MKINSNCRILGLFLAILGTTLSGCKENSKPYDDVVYLLAAERSNFTSMSADDSGGELALIIKSSNLVNARETVTLAPEPGMIEDYNRKTGRAYSALPTGSYELSSNQATIEAGTNLSQALSFKVTDISGFKEGVSYLMPITIRHSSALQVLEASKTLYIEVKKVTIASVASLTSNYFHVDFSQNNAQLKAVQTFSFECRVMVNKFQSSSPFISSVMGIEETLLLRFGDVTVQPNQLQVAGGATATNVAQAFNTGTWYHLACSYDGTALKVYVDGELVATTPASRTLDLTGMWEGGFHFGYSARGRYLDGYISEARVWSKALTQGEIRNGACGIDPATPGLIGYWKFNEGEGKIAHDISGNERHAVAARDVTWKPDVRCE